MSKVKFITKVEAIDKVKNSISSLYSKDDVIYLLEQIAAGNSVDEDDEDMETFTKAEVKAMLETVKDRITGEIEYGASIDDICNLDEIELTLSGREIEIDTSNVSFDTTSITDAVESTIDDFISDL